MAFLFLVKLKLEAEFNTHQDMTPHFSFIYVNPLCCPKQQVFALANENLTGDQFFSREKDVSVQNLVSLSWDPSPHPP